MWVLCNIPISWVSAIDGCLRWSFLYPEHSALPTIALPFSQNKQMARHRSIFSTCFDGTGDFPSSIQWYYSSTYTLLVPLYTLAIAAISSCLRGVCICFWCPSAKLSIHRTAYTIPALFANIQNYKIKNNSFSLFLI